MGRDMSCGPYGLALPYDAQVEPANVKDASVFKTMFVPEATQLVLADSCA